MPLPSASVLAEAIVVPRLYRTRAECDALADPMARFYAMTHDEFRVLCDDTRESVDGRSEPIPITYCHQPDKGGTHGQITRMWIEGDVGKAEMTLPSDGVVTTGLRAGWPYVVSLSHAEATADHPACVSEVSIVLDPGRPGSAITHFDGLPYTPAVDLSKYTSPPSEHTLQAASASTMSTDTEMKDPAAAAAPQPPAAAPVTRTTAEIIALLPEDARAQLAGSVNALMDAERQTKEQMAAMKDADRQKTEKMQAMSERLAKMEAEKAEERVNDSSAMLLLFTEMLAAMDVGVGEEDLEKMQKMMQTTRSLDDVASDAGMREMIRAAGATFHARQTRIQDGRDAAKQVRQGNAQPSSRVGAKRRRTEAYIPTPEPDASVRAASAALASAAPTAPPKMNALAHALDALHGGNIIDAWRSQHRA